VQCEQCIIPLFISIHETRDPFFSRLFRAKSTSFCYLVWLGRFVPEKGVDLVIEVEKGTLFQQNKL
jgi:glycosyltransferase involved in cell wall biosynthesis